MLVPRTSTRVPCRRKWWIRRSGSGLSAFLVGLVTAVGRIVFRIKAFFSGMMDAINEAMGPIDEILLPVRLAVAELMLALGELFGGMDTEAVGGATSAWAGFGKLLGGLVGAFSRIGEALAPLLARIFGGEITTGTSAWETFGTILGGTVALAVNLVATGLGIIVNGVNMLVNGLTFVVSIFTGDIPAAAGAFRAILESWGEGFALIGDLFGVGDSIRGAWADVMAYFDSINLFESGAKLMATFADGIKSLAMAPLEAVTGALTWVRNLLPFSDAKTGLRLLLWNTRHPLCVRKSQKPEPLHRVRSPRPMQTEKAQLQRWIACLWVCNEHRRTEFASHTWRSGTTSHAAYCADLSTANPPWLLQNVCLRLRVCAAFL